MSGELTVFETALAQLKAQMPDTFDLEVEDHVFRNVGSFAQAARITRTMEGMKSEAAAMGYAVKTEHVNGTVDAPWRRVWRYSFVKTRLARNLEEIERRMRASESMFQVQMDLMDSVVSYEYSNLRINALRLEFGYDFSGWDDMSSGYRVFQFVKRSQAPASDLRAGGITEFPVEAKPDSNEGAIDV